MNKYFTNILEEEAQKMQFYSTQSLNELGFYTECESEFEGRNSFVVMNSNVSYMSGFSRKGHCFPKECT